MSSSSTIQRRLFHVLYTNAAGEGDSDGFRHLDVLFPGAKEELQPIKDWLTGLKPNPQSRQGWATYSFKVGGLFCPALAVIDPAFSLDDRNRSGGWLAHALLVMIQEGQPAGHFGRALYQKAFQFLEESRSNPSRSLQGYLEGCKVNQALEIPMIRPEDLLSLDRVFVETLCEAAASPPASEVFFPGVVDEEELPERLVLASAGLPPRLRLVLRWKVGLQAGGEGFVAQPGPAGIPAPSRDGLGALYVERLWSRLQSGRTEEIVTMVNSDWEFLKWEQLVQAIVQPEPEAAEEAVEMAKKTQRPAPGNASQPAPGRPGKSAVDYDEEYRNLYEDVKEYVDKRFMSLEMPSSPPQRKEGEPGQDGLGSKVFVRWWKTWRPEIYFLIVLVILGVMNRHILRPAAEKKKPPPVAGEKGPAPGLSPSPVDGTENDEEPPADPFEKWVSFMSDNPAITETWFRRVAAHQGLEPGQVSDSQRRFFLAAADNLAAGKTLNIDEVTRATTGLFEYVHALWAKEQGVGKPQRDVVTNDPSEAADRLVRIARSLGLEGNLDLKPGVKDSRVQAAVVRAWIDRHSNS